MSRQSPNGQVLLRVLSKITCFATFFLIFAGSMVTSTGSGLAVPDWPLSYGMLFPPMIGGVFYEHGHRMVAATVGFLMFLLTLGLLKFERRRWVRNLGFAAMGAVVLQGVLGGITVLFFLPTFVSVGHAVLAQTFFILTIILAYSESKELAGKNLVLNKLKSEAWIRWTMIAVFAVYVQLIIGALMRHTGSGLAIPDFPMMAGHWWPEFNEDMLTRINHWRFDHNLGVVTLGQVLIHFLHRLGAMVILLILVVLNKKGFEKFKDDSMILRTLVLLDIFFILQISLGISTVLTLKVPLIASLHVLVGAGILGWSVLLFVRSVVFGSADTR